jgi:hypothetical protein
MSMSPKPVNGNTPNLTNVLSGAGQGLAPGIQGIVGQAEADLEAKMVAQEQLKVLKYLGEIMDQQVQV